MFVVAQRVVAPEGEGINAFYRAHGAQPDWVWEVPEGIPDGKPGDLKKESIQVRGQGRVRSFLDIAAPDGTSPEQLWWAHHAIVALAGVDARFPLVVVSGPVFVRYDLESQLLGVWHGELHALLDAALALVPGPARVP
jgi:hypothetical protein